METLIVANWKMNPKSLKEAKILFDKVKRAGAVICPPFVYISALKANGAQDVEVSPIMLKDLGVEYVILGHSERKKYLGETREIINKKIKTVLSAGLKPIVCFEEIQEIKNLPKDLIFAFEPASAISGGGAYKPYQLKKAKKMRQSLASFPEVLYGGSVNSQNANDYIKKAGFQGLLVGKASLDAKEFIGIVKSVN